MKIFFARLLILMVMQTLASVSYARETGYEVELIIFEDIRARYLQSEDWSYNDMLRNKKDSPEKEVEIDPEYKEINWDGSKLAGNLERLKNNSNYRVLVTKRWKQTGLDREHAFNIPIINDTDNVETKVDVDLPAVSDAPQELEHYVTGNVKLIMSRYLHFNVDLQYNRFQNDENGEVQHMVLPVVNERRMRSREIHYIDHPLVGVVVLATPYEIKTIEDDASTTEYKTM